MLINRFAKQWCDEDYDIRKEDFYVENARWMVARCWREAAPIHGVIAAIATYLHFQASGFQLAGVLGALMLLSTLTIAFYFYGLRA